MTPARTTKYCAVANFSIALLWFSIAVNTQSLVPFVLGSTWIVITAANTAVWRHLHEKEKNR